MFNNKERDDIFADLRKVVYDYEEVRDVILHRAEMLYDERLQANKLLGDFEKFINSLVNTPKELQATIEEMKIEYKNFNEAVIGLEIESKKVGNYEAVGKAGVVAGVGVVTLAPTAAMAIATTFGTASTGIAIASLSGAAANSAALAWLGGGALAAGGGGMAAGNAMLAMAGPVGWFIAGGALVTSAYLMNSKNKDIIKEAREQVHNMNCGIAEITKKKAEINSLIDKTKELRESLEVELKKFISKNITDYKLLSVEEKQILGAFVNSVKALAALLNKKVA